MTREQLDAGKKADEELWQAVAEKYNDILDEDLDKVHYDVYWRLEPDPARGG